MLLERLVVIYGWLYGHRATEKEGITHFHARHDVVITAAGMQKLTVGTEEDAILLYIVASAHAHHKLGGYGVIAATLV